MYLIINKVKGYSEEVSGNKYFALVPNNENKEIIKKDEELCSKIKDQIRTKTHNSVDYDEKNIQIKFNSDDYLPLTK